MANRIQLRRGNGQEWQNSNPILAQGELGIELDTGRFKIGDGVTPWNTLRYERPIESTSNTANTLVQRDNDGNFSAATITATIIGNASTASRLASSRQIQLIGDVSGSQIFDGSENISISAALDLLSSLPHHDNTDTSSGTYTKVTVDAKGRVINASNPTTLADYYLNGTVEGSSAQAYDLDLVALAGLTTTGFISRTASNTMATRTITGTAGKINVNNRDRNGEQVLESLTFEDQYGNTDQYRFMSKEVVEQQLKTVKFKGVNWNVSFEPTKQSVQELAQIASIYASMQQSNQPFRLELKMVMLLLGLVLTTVADMLASGFLLGM